MTREVLEDVLDEGATHCELFVPVGGTTAVEQTIRTVCDECRAWEDARMMGATVRIVPLVTRSQGPDALLEVVHECAKLRSETFYVVGVCLHDKHEVRLARRGVTAWYHRANSVFDVQHAPLAGFSDALA